MGRSWEDGNDQNTMRRNKVAINDNKENDNNNKDGVDNANGNNDATALLQSMTMNLK